jgi:hypothetical protein
MSDTQNTINSLKSVMDNKDSINKAKEKPNKYVDTPEARSELLELSEELLNVIPNGFNTKGKIEYVNRTDENKRLFLTVRLLSAEEEMDIRNDVENAVKQKNITDIQYQMYLTFCKVLSRATQASSLCTDGDFKGISIKSFKEIPLSELEILYRSYMDWVEKATPSPYDIPQEQLNTMTDELKKKPQLCLELERRYLVPILIYFITLCDNQEARLRYLEEETARLLQMES